MLLVLRRIGSTITFASPLNEETTLFSFVDETKAVSADGLIVHPPLSVSGEKNACFRLSYKLMRKFKLSITNIWQ